MSDNNDDTLTTTSEDKPFGPNEESAIISLAFDAPEFFCQVGKFMKHKYFQKLHNQFVYGIIEDYFEKYNCVPTREIALDVAHKNLTVDDDYKPIIAAINRKSNPREIQAIKDTLLKWTKAKAYGLVYSDDAMQAWMRKDFETIDQIYEQARQITDVSKSGINFFDSIPTLFEVESEIKLTTGFSQLDLFINEGGPTRGDVFLWMAPTGVGKSIMLVHNGKALMQAGLNVLHVTLELSEKKTMQRYMGAMTNEVINTRFDRRGDIEQKLYRIKADTKGSLLIVEFPPEEITVDTLHQLVDMLKRTKGWCPDVVIIDYLELMMSRSSYDNKEDYVRQKRVATQIRGFARKENVLVFSATQTNRDGAGGGNSQGGGGGGGAEGGGRVLDLNKVAESYGKTMPTDYVVSINQAPDEYNQEFPMLRFYIAKNRNGPKFKTVRARVNYKTMCVKQEEIVP